MYQMSFFSNEIALRSSSITKQTRRESHKKGQQRSNTYLDIRTTRIRSNDSTRDRNGVV